MKKFFSLVLALVMALSLTTVAWGADPVATVDGVDCADWAAVKTAVAADSVVTLLDDVVLPQSGGLWTITASNVTLDLNGFELSRDISGDMDANGYTVIYVNGGSLTIKDGSTAKTGTISIEQASGATGAPYAVNVKAGTVTLESGNIVSSGKGVVVTAGGTFKMTGGSVTGTSDDEDVVRLTDGTFVMDGGTLSGGGTGVFADDGVVTMNGGEIKNSKHAVTIEKGSFEMNGGSVSATVCGVCTNGQYDADLTVNAGTITGAVVGVYFPSEGALSISGGAISGATGVYVKSGSVAVTGGTISGTGAAADYAFNANGCNPTGDALVIENVGADGYEAVTSVSVTGGTFTSTNGDAVASYDAEKNSAVDAVDEFVEGGTFSGNVDDALVVNGSGLVKDTNGNLLAVPTVTFGDKFDLYLANAGMNTALKLETPTVAGLTFNEVAAKTNKDGTGNVAYIAANNGQYFVKTTTPTIVDYAVTEAGKTTVLYYVTVAGTSAANFEYVESVTAFDKFSTYAKCDYVTGTPVVGKTYFMASDDLVYMAGAAGTGANYLLNGKVVSGTYAGTPEEHTFALNGYKYDATLKQNVPTSALCTKCMMNTGSIYLRTKVPATYTLYTTTGEGSVNYTVALPGTAVGGTVVVPSTDKVESAATFDAGIAMYVGMSVMAAAGSAVVIGKKKD